MMRFSRWILEHYKLMERKKAHYSKYAHDAENYPQVAQEYDTLRNTSKSTLKQIAQNRGINPNEPVSKLTSDILKKEYPDKVGGFYDKEKDTAYKVKTRKKAKKAAEPSYRKNDDE